MAKEDKQDEKTPDRVTVDIFGLRDRIEQAMDSIEWRELSLNGKIRALINYGLEAVASKNHPPSDR